MIVVQKNQQKKEALLLKTVTMTAISVYISTNMTLRYAPLTCVSQIDRRCTQTTHIG